MFRLAYCGQAFPVQRSKDVCTCIYISLAWMSLVEVMGLSKGSRTLFYHMCLLLDPNSLSKPRMTDRKKTTAVSALLTNLSGFSEFILIFITIFMGFNVSDSHVRNLKPLFGRCYLMLEIIYTYPLSCSVDT